MSLLIEDGRLALQAPSGTWYWAFLLGLLGSDGQTRYTLEFEEMAVAPDDGTDAQAVLQVGDLNIPLTVIEVGGYPTWDTGDPVETEGRPYIRLLDGQTPILLRLVAEGSGYTFDLQAPEYEAGYYAGVLGAAFDAPAVYYADFV